MTVEEIINGDGELTSKVLDGLNLKDLGTVAKELFEIKSISKYTKGELLDECKKKLEEAMHSQNKNTVENFVRDLDNQEKAVGMALNIRRVFDRRWFTAEELVKVYTSAITNNISKIEDPEKKKEAQKNFRENPPTVDSVKAELSTLSLFALVKTQSGKKTRYKIVMTVVTKALNRRKNEELAKQKAEEHAKEQSTEEITAE